MHLVSHNAVSGPEINALDLAVGLAARDHQVWVAGPGGNWMEETVQKSNAHWINLPFKRLGLVRSVLKVLEAVRAHQIDIVHVHLSRASYAGWIASWFCKIPVVASVHVATRNRLFKFLAKPPHRLIAVSHYLKDFLVKTGIDDARIEVIHIGSRMVARPTTEGEMVLGFLTGDRVISLVGKVSELKGHHLAVEAFESLASDFPDVHLLFVGDDTNEFARHLRTVIQSPRIHFLGLQAELSSFYLKSEFTILPTEIETFGMVVTESMLCGRPVIGSNRGALPELIQNEHTGLIVERDAKSFELAMRRLLSDPTATAEMGQTAKLYAHDHFSLEPMINAVEKVYKSCNLH